MPVNFHISNDGSIDEIGTNRHFAGTFNCSTNWTTDYLSINGKCTTVLMCANLTHMSDKTKWLNEEKKKKISINCVYELSTIITKEIRANEINHIYHFVRNEKKKKTVNISTEKCPSKQWPGKKRSTESERERQLLWLHSRDGTQVYCVSCNVWLARTQTLPMNAMQQR